MKTFLSVLLLAALAVAGNCLFRRRIFFNAKPLSWADAQTFCRSKAVDLVTINSLGEHNAFQKALVGFPDISYWIGLAKRPDEKDFTQWSDGTIKKGFAKWSANEPSSPTLEHCVMMASFLWFDQSCTDTFASLCYTWVPKPILVPEMKTWNEALVHCRTFYTDLVSVSTDPDLFVVSNKSITGQTPGVWTGLRFMDGEWLWVNNEPLGSLVSPPSCPLQSFHCGARTGQSVAESRDCNERMSFVCY